MRVKQGRGRDGTIRSRIPDEGKGRRPNEGRHHPPIRPVGGRCVWGIWVKSMVNSEDLAELLVLPRLCGAQNEVLKTSEHLAMGSYSRGSAGKNGSRGSPGTWHFKLTSKVMAELRELMTRL